MLDLQWRISIRSVGPLILSVALSEFIGFVFIQESLQPVTAFCSTLLFLDDSSLSLTQQTRTVSRLQVRVRRSARAASAFAATLRLRISSQAGLLPVSRVTVGPPPNGPARRARPGPAPAGPGPTVGRHGDEFAGALARPGRRARQVSESRQPRHPG